LRESCLFYTQIVLLKTKICLFFEQLSGFFLDSLF